MKDSFNARSILTVGKKEYVIYRLDALEKAGLTELKRLPFSIRIMLEAALRQCNDKEIKEDDVQHIAAWTAVRRDAVAAAPVSPSCRRASSCRISPAYPLSWTWPPCARRSPAWAATRRRSIRLSRLTWSSIIRSRSISLPLRMRCNAIRRSNSSATVSAMNFSKWGQKSLQNFRVVPPMTGIVHQVNLEYLADVVDSPACARFGF